MLVTIREANDADKELLKNLYVFFRYDLMPFLDGGPTSCINSHGVITLDGENSRTHSEGIADVDEYWDHPGKVFPMLIEVDGNPAGFAVVGTHPFVDKSVDYRLYDFYVLNLYRGRGVAREAAIQVFDRFPGVWEIGWLAKNKPADACWRSVVREYTGDAYEDWVYDGGLPGVKFTSGR